MIDFYFDGLVLYRRHADWPMVACEARHVAELEPNPKGATHAHSNHRVGPIRYDGVVVSHQLELRFCCLQLMPQLVEFRERQLQMRVLRRAVWELSM